MASTDPDGKAIDTTLTEADRASIEAFVRRHGRVVLASTLEYVDDYLVEYRIQALPTVLGTAILWGELRPRSRFHIDQAVKAMREGLTFTMVAKAEPDAKRRGEAVDITSMVGDTVKFDVRLHELCSVSERAV